MDRIAWLMLAAAMLPYVCAILAKAGGRGFDNNAPRPWLAGLQGWRARANAAQQNLFEGLPFYFAAVLFALLYRQADPQALAGWMLLWLAARVAFIGAYVAGRGLLRSLFWALALAVNIVILFA